jgi:hypothetical protein
VVYPGVLLEVLAELVELFDQGILLLLRIVNELILILLKRELNVEELVDILVVDELGLKELDSGDPVVPVVLTLASELDVPNVGVKDTLPDVLGDRHFEVETGSLHDGLEDLEYVLHLDHAKRSLVSLVLLVVVVPDELFACEDQQSFGDLLAGLLALFEDHALVKWDVLVIGYQYILHLLDDNTVFLFEGQGIL